MNLPENLLQLYGQWRMLTHAESAAIAGPDWHAVEECQRAKRRLQDQILEETERSQAQTVAAGVSWTQVENAVRPLVMELIALETKNLEHLAEKKKSLEIEDAELRRAGRTLRQVKEAYVGGPSGFWTQYS